MSDARKVYILTQGEYSDYRIVGVFSTKEAAQSVTDKLPNSGREPIEIEEYLIDEMVSWEVGPTFTVSIQFANGSVYRSARSDERLRHPTKSDIHTRRFGLTVVSPISLKHAEKVAIEQYQRQLRETALNQVAE